MQHEQKTERARSLQVWGETRAYQEFLSSIQKPQPATNFKFTRSTFPYLFSHICLWRSTCFDFLLSVYVCVCVCVSTILYKYRLSRVCIYTRQTFKSVLWENILRRCIPLNRWSCKQLIEMIICWDEKRIWSFFFIDSSDKPESLLVCY